jgi:nucleoside-diphosphate-sugar epimerase
MNRVLVTGASGFIGTRCIVPLLARGYEVHAVSTRMRQDDGVKWHQANLLDPEQITSLVKLVRPSHLLHLAWDVTPGAFWTSQLNVRWLNASLTLAEAFVRAGGQRIVMTGSCAEYRSTEEPCREDSTPIAPTTLYGASKAALGIVVPACTRELGVASTAWARVFYLYGPGEQTSRLVPSVIQSLRRGAAIPCSVGDRVRDFLYVDDVAGALAALLDSEVTGPVNVASGVPTTIRGLLEMIGDHMGNTHLLQFGARPSAPDEPAVLVADVTRLTRDVGWTPSVSLREGVKRTIEWWQSEDTHAN